MQYRPRSFWLSHATSWPRAAIEPVTWSSSQRCREVGASSPGPPGTVGAAAGPHRVRAAATVGDVVASSTCRRDRLIGLAVAARPARRGPGLVGARHGVDLVSAAGTRRVVVAGRAPTMKAPCAVAASAGSPTELRAPSADPLFETTLNVQAHQ